MKAFFYGQILQLELYILKKRCFKVPFVFQSPVVAKLSLSVKIRADPEKKFPKVFLLFIFHLRLKGK